MAKKKVKDSPGAALPSLSEIQPTTRFEFPGGLPENLPGLGKPIHLKVHGKLVGGSAPVYPGDRHSIRVQLGKVTVHPRSAQKQ